MGDNLSGCAQKGWTDNRFTESDLKTSNSKVIPEFFEQSQQIKKKEFEWIIALSSMNPIENVLQRLQGVPSFSASIPSATQHMQSMEDLVQRRLADATPLTKGEWNKVRNKMGDVTKSLESCKAVGFCLAGLAYFILESRSSSLLLSLNEFLPRYPEYATSDYSKQQKELNMCNFMIAALAILQGKNNKGVIMEIVAKLCDGEEGQFISGGGLTEKGKRQIPVEKYFVRESGITPGKSRKPTGSLTISKRPRTATLEAVASHSDSTSASNGNSSSSSEGHSASKQRSKKAMKVESPEVEQPDAAASSPPPSAPADATTLPSDPKQYYGTHFTEDKLQPS